MNKSYIGIDPYDFGHKTLSEVAERVSEGAVQGFERDTSDYLAASYALNACQCEIDADKCVEISEEVTAHLDILAEAGAKFNAEEAKFIAWEMV